MSGSRPDLMCPAHPTQPAIHCACDAAAQAVADAEQRRAQLLAGLHNGTWLGAQSFPELEWIVHALVPEGFELLAGGPKVGKSRFVVPTCLAVAAGTYALGAVPVKQRPVFLLALEDGDRRLQDRARAAMGDADLPPGWDYLTRVQPTEVLPTIEAWLAGVESTGPPPWVILDTLGKVMPPALPGESAYQRDYRIGSRLKWITDGWPGMALTALHHDRKAAAEDFVQTVSGTNGLAGAADTIALLNKPRGQTVGTLLVTGRDVEDAEYRVSLTASGWSLMGGSLDAAAEAAAEYRETDGLGDRSVDVLRAVNASPRGLGPMDVAAMLGMSNDDAGKYLRRLADAGRIRKVSRGHFVSLRSTSEVSELSRDSPTSDQTSGVPSGLSNLGHSDASDALLGKDPA